MTACGKEFRTALILLFIVLSTSHPILPVVAAQRAVILNLSFTINSLVEINQNGFTGVNASWKSNMAASMTANVWFVAYNSKNLPVFVSFAQLPFAPDGSNAAFQTFSSALPSGTYVVQTFVVTWSGTILSPSPEVTISF